LIPPASVVGIGLAFGRFDILFHSLGLLLVNVWGLNVGSIIVLSLWGIEPSPLELEKKIRKITESTINNAVKADEIRSGIVLHSYEKADVYVRLYAFGIQDHEERLLAGISEEIKRKTGVSNNVRVTVYPVRMFTS